MKYIYIYLLVLAVFLFSTCNDKNLDKDFTDGKVTFKTISQIPIVEGTLNGKKVFYIIDSGASISVLDESQKDKYNFKSSTSGNFNAVGYGGRASFQEAKETKGELGGVKIDIYFKSQDLSSLVKTIRTNSGYSIIGILGCDFLSKHKIIIDFEKNELRKPVIQ